MAVVTKLEPVVSELRQLEESMIRSLRQRLPEQLAATYYAPGARVQAPGRKPAEGPPAIVEFWRSLFGAGLIDIRLESQRVAAEHDLAYAATAFVATFETQPGMLRRDPGGYLTVFRRQADGCWRAVEQSLSFNTVISVP